MRARAARFRGGPAAAGARPACCGAAGLVADAAVHDLHRDGGWNVGAEGDSCHEQGEGGQDVGCGRDARGGADELVGIVGQPAALSRALDGVNGRSEQADQLGPERS
eukprot:scaffold18700_cov132-Isochrysis_galbana.AAC.3